MFTLENCEGYPPKDCTMILEAFRRVSSAAALHSVVDMLLKEHGSGRAQSRAALC